MDDLPGETADSELPNESGDEFEAVFVQTIPDPEPLVEKPDRESKPIAKTGAPSLEEWQDFIGRFVIRGITEAYLTMVLGDLEEELTPRERELIRLTKDDLKELSAPLATMAQKSKFGRRKGRAIIAAADSGEAVVALLIWMRRVNRIAKKYRKSQPQTVPGYVVEGNSNGNSGPDGGQGPQYGGPGSWGVFNPGSG